MDSSLGCMLVIYSFDDARFRKMSILVGCRARIRWLHEEVMYVRVSLRVIMIGSMRASVQEGCEGDESMIFKKDDPKIESIMSRNISQRCRCFAVLERM